MTLFLNSYSVKKQISINLFLNDDLIDDSFGYQFVLEPTYSFSIITSATHEPDQLKDRLLTELKKYRGKIQKHLNY